MILVGIDPGLSGAICVLGNNKDSVIKLPVNDKDIDIGSVAKWLKSTVGGDPVALAVIEKVGAMPKQGVVSMFRFGQATGQLIGMIQALDIPLIRPTPQQWKKVVLAGTSKDKEAAIAYVRNRYPLLSLLPTPKSRVPDDGMADAVCLAEYGLYQVNHRPKGTLTVAMTEGGDLWE